MVTILVQLILNLIHIIQYDPQYRVGLYRSGMQSTHLGVASHNGVPQHKRQET